MKPVSSLFKQFIQVSDFADSTIDCYGRAVTFFIEANGDMPVDEIKPSHIEKMKKHLLDEDKKKAGINQYVRNLSGFFRWLNRPEGEIKTNPMYDVKYYKTERKKGRIYHTEELVQILQVCNDRWRVIFLLALWAGLRRGEVLNLCWADLDFGNNRIWVRAKEDTEATWFWHSKNIKQRFVPFPDIITLPGITLHLHTLCFDLMEENVKTNPKQPYLCPTPKYYRRLIEKKNKGTLSWRKRYCPWGNFSRDLKVILKRAMVSQKSFHDLRRTFGTALDRNNFTLPKIQSVLGHSSPQTTIAYIRVDDGVNNANVCQLAQAGL